MFLAPQPMHIPDGFLSIVVDLLLWIAAIIAVGYSLKRVGQDIGERQVPLMGVLAAAIFAGQMLNGLPFLVRFDIDSANDLFSIFVFIFRKLLEGTVLN